MNSILEFPKNGLITQADLAEERILETKANLWSKLWLEKKREILECLLRGGTVEEGPLTAELDVRVR